MSAYAEPAPGLAAERDRIERDIIGTLGPMGIACKLWLLFLLVGCTWGLIGFVYQLKHGLATTGMTNYFSWGFYIINFVFFIGISHAGTLVSAILRVTGTGWRKPITRMAEGITAIALLVGAPMVIIDMGIPGRLMNVFTHGRFQSPILWDVIAVTTYFTGSLMYLYLPMIPDMAILRDRGHMFKPWRRWLYTKLSLGWTGTPEQRRLLNRCIATMAVIIIPVAISVHTVVSYIFSMTLRPGWHSTIFGPYFVVGAIFSGIAALITAMVVFRWCFRAQRLSQFLTDTVIKKLSLLLLAVNLTYIYFTASEYLTIGYTAPKHDTHLVHVLMSGQYAGVFWFVIAVGLFIPALLLSLPWTRTVPGITVAAILINIGMWLKRYVIVIPTLSQPIMPVGVELTYTPTWVEWSITVGAFALFLLLYTLFAKLFPIVSIWEVSEDLEEAGPSPEPIPGSATPKEVQS